MSSISTPIPYPGAPLKQGSSGLNVKYMQYLLDGIQQFSLPTIGFLKVDGIYGAKTQSAVQKYQILKKIAADGIIGRNTWNAILADHAALPSGKFEIYPGLPIVQGSNGIAVEALQLLFNAVSPTYMVISTLTVDGKFGQNAVAATRMFQKLFGLTADGTIGPKTWDMLVLVKKSVAGGSPKLVVAIYPGRAISQGAGGDNVRLIQALMNAISAASGGFYPAVKVDGSFGTNTRNLVMAFQKYVGLTVDGVVGANTWAKMVQQFNALL